MLEFVLKQLKLYLKLFISYYFFIIIYNLFSNYLRLNVCDKYEMDLTIINFESNFHFYNPINQTYILGRTQGQVYCYQIVVNELAGGAVHEIYFVYSQTDIWIPLVM